MLIYETVEEATQRLKGTVFLYQDQVVYCHEVGVNKNGQLDMHLTFWPKGREEARVLLTDPDINYRLYNLGYMNTSGGATYVTRMPSVGSYKQGLYQSNLRFTRVGGKDKGYKPDFGRIYQQAGFRDMLLQKYPSLDEAVKRLETDEELWDVAFHPNFSIGKDRFRGDYLLNYRGDKIGFGSREFRITDQFGYLRDYINQSNIKVV